MRTCLCVCESFRPNDLIIGMEITFSEPLDIESSWAQTSHSIQIFGVLLLGGHKFRNLESVMVC